MGMDPITIMAGASLAGGLLGADASENAADTMAGSAQQSAATQRAMFDRQVGLEEPFRAAGTDALYNLQNYLGIGNARDANTGTLLKPFGADDFQLDPGTQFRIKYGEQALQNSQAAKNGTLTGASLKDLLTFNQDYAGTGYQSAFDRYMAGKQLTLGSLMGVSNLGQAAASGATNGGAGYASAIGNSITGAGQAQGAGTVGAANALSSGLGGASNAYFLSSLMNKGNPAAASPGAGVVGDFPMNQFA